MLVTARGPVLLDVLEPAAVGPADAGAVGGGALQQRPAPLRERRSTCPGSRGSRAALYYLLPNLAPFNVKAEVVYGMAIGRAHVVYTLVYAAIYIGALLLAAMAIFRRRDFK